MSNFNILFSSPLSPIAPSMSFLVSQEEERKKKMRVKLMTTFKPSWVSSGLGLGLGFGLRLTNKKEEDTKIVKLDGCRDLKKG